jgi:RNA polymerase sigma factor (sigma-70 family)
MTPDCELLREFARTNSADAFAELVKRHLNLVYSAALRQVNGDGHLAKDVAQSVFTDLARKAHSLSRRENLSGWLYTSAHFAATKIIRGENRRRDREAQFMRETINETGSDGDWEKIRSALDEAMHELKQSDREAILLRYFENRPFAELGAKLDLNENAARMRVERALEKLRGIFARRGIVTAAALAAVISANAVQLAPPNLAAVLTTASLTAAQTGTFTFVKTIIAAKLKLAFSAIAVAGATAAFVHQQTVQNKLRDQNESLQQQVAQLQTDNVNFSNRLAETGGDAQKLSDDQFNELLRLRGEVGGLRQQASEVAKLRDENQQLQEAATQLQTSNDRMAFADSLAKFKGNEAQVINAMKQVGLADRIWAGDNNNQYAGSFDQMTNELGGLYNSPLLENIEFVNVGIANPTQDLAMIIFREHNPRQCPDGTWHRVYCLADGSVQIAISSDDNFGAYERYDSVARGTIFSPPNQNQ